MKQSSTQRHIWILSLILTAFTLRISELDNHSLWYDELLQLDIAQGPLSQLLPQLSRHSAMPLDYLILHLWVDWGRQEAWVRLPAALLSTLSIPLIYQLGRVMFSPPIGLLAAALLTVSSFAVRYAQEVRPYSLLLLTVMLAYYGVWLVYQSPPTARAAARRRKGWVLTFIGMIGAALSHYFALFAFVPLGLLVLVQQLRQLRSWHFWRQTGLFGVAVLGIGLTFILAGRPLTIYSVGYRFTTNLLAQPDTLTQPAAAKPNRGEGPDISLTFFVDEMVAPLTSGFAWAQLLSLGLLLVAVVGAIATKAIPLRRDGLLLCVGWLFVPCLLTYLFLLHRGTFYAERYIIYTLPAIALLLAVGLSWLINRSRRVALVGSLLLLTPLLLTELVEISSHRAGQPYEDWRAVAQLLTANARADDAVIAVRGESSLNWYYPQATFPPGSFDQTAGIMREVEQHERRWFVLSSYSRSRDQPVRDWVTQHGGVLLAIDRRVIVYFQQAGLSHAEQLAQVEQFELPHKPHTYGMLGLQLERAGQLAASARFYRRAIEVAGMESDRAAYQSRLTRLLEQGDLENINQ